MHQTSSHQRKPKKCNYLVTGASSGLGCFLKTQLQAQGFCRQAGIASLLNNSVEPFEAIIHCAFNVNRGITSANLQQYVSDNVLLTQQLLTLPHKKFIFISSADVYPRDSKTWQEDDEFAVEKIEGLYGLSKLMCEALIKSQSDNYLILRPTAMLGTDARPNSLIKMLNGHDAPLTLSAQSCFNYILHHDVLQFIQAALSNDLRGTFNLAAKDNVVLGEVASHFEKEVKFGSFVYNVATLCNQKAMACCEVFAHSSLENIKRFQSITRDNVC